MDGEDLTNTPIEKRQIGMVFQSYALFPTMSVYENIAFGLKVQKNKKEEIKKRVEELAKVVDLKEEQLKEKCIRIIRWTTTTCSDCKSIGTCSKNHCFR